MFQFDDGGDGLPAHIFDGILVAEPVGSFDRIVHMPLPTVFAEIAETGCNAALGARQPDFLTPYLRAVFGIIGLRNLTFFSVQGTAFGPEALDEARRKADGALLAHFATSAS